MKIVITGATGFIGRNFAMDLHRMGHDVVASGRSANVGAQLHSEGIRFLQLDLLDRPAVEESIPQADCLIHCAAKTGDWGEYEDFHKINVIGTENIISSCLKNNIPKIIFISSPSIYFNGKDRLNIKEDEPLPSRQVTAYGETKVLAEERLHAAKDKGINIIILRPRAVFGRYDTTIFPRIFKLSDKPKVPVINGGNALIDITYVENLTAAISNCLEAPDSAWNETYNVSNGDPLRLRDWIEQILKIYDRPFNPKPVPELMVKMLAGVMEFTSKLPFGNKKPMFTRFSVGYMAKSMTLSIEKAEAKLGYSPKISNEEGFRLCRQWFGPGT